MISFAVIPAGGAESSGPFPNSQTYCAQSGKLNSVLASTNRAQRKSLRPGMLTSADAVVMAAYDIAKRAAGKPPVLILLARKHPPEFRRPCCYWQSLCRMLGAGGPSTQGMALRYS